MKHGDRRRAKTAPEYRSWHRMMQRCYNPNHRSYANYGGRGITVYPGWHDYIAFRAAIVAVIGRKPSPKHTLERIDNDRAYEPGNVCWATAAEQSINRRNTVLIEGQKLAVLARQHGLSARLLWVRMIRDGWPLDKALKTPAGAIGSGGTQIIVECPHCGKTGNIAIMSRWHFDRCKKHP